MIRQPPWQPLWVRWYDGGVRCLQVSSGTALWYRSGQPPLPLSYGLWSVIQAPSTHLGLTSRRAQATRQVTS